MSAELTQTVSGTPPRAGNVPLATAGLLIGMLLSVLDQTVVAIALPDIAADLGGMDAIGRVVTSYVLASTATGALYGRISDRFGRRTVFVTAVAVFVTSSALCGLAQTMPQLVAARTLQGIGAGALFVLPTIALSELYPQHLRSRVQGFTGGVFALLAVELGVLGAGFGLLMQNLVVVAQNAAPPADLAATTSATVSIRGLGLSLGVAVSGNLLTRELQSRAPSPEATAAAIPGVLVWGVPAAVALVALMVLLPRTVDHPVPGKATT
ncbi:MFS transporter [Streptosporangium canum]|uniref:MFS transporter n=1 Tax=Streptosporangium canum TaxID=324952 RepID=UPI0034373FBC